MNKILYSVESQTSRGVVTVGEFADKREAVKIMHDQGRTSVVRNSTGRIVATSLARTF